MTGRPRASLAAPNPSRRQPPPSRSLPEPAPQLRRGLSRTGQPQPGRCGAEPRSKGSAETTGSAAAESLPPQILQRESDIIARNGPLLSDRFRISRACELNRDFAPVSVAAALAFVTTETCAGTCFCVPGVVQRSREMIGILGHRRKSSADPGEHQRMSAELSLQPAFARTRPGPSCRAAVTVLTSR